MKWRASWLFLFVIAAIVGGMNDAHAQENALAVTITHPGEGETLYSSPTAPFSNVIVTGWVSASEFQVTQLQVRLEVLQEPTRIGILTATPLPNGAFSFDVAINSNPLSELSSPEKGCKGNCHALMPLSLPSGTVLLRVVVTDPLGRKATAQRLVIVDQSGYATVPVQVVVADHPGQHVGGLRVIATTRLYDWRAREYTAITDIAGRAVLHPEALGQAPTVYLLRIEPCVINGILYSSPAPLKITLPPGTNETEPVQLEIASQLGKIEGRLDPKKFSNFPNIDTLTIRAVQISSGATYTTKTAQGKFALENLPIAKYLLSVAEEDAAALGAQVAPQAVDLTANPGASATLQLLPLSTPAVRGSVRDDAGNPLPLVWVTTQERGKSIRVSVSNGEFVWFGFPTDAPAVWVTAPGYWRRPVALDSDQLAITLTREPETRAIPWGNGTITLPPETIATLAENHLMLRRGWVWGKGSGLFSITTPELEIALQRGAFALESIPDATSWLYIIDGLAFVTVLDHDENLTMTSNQMLAFGKGVTHPFPVPLERGTVHALHAGEPSPVQIETDPAPLARLRDETARRGIPMAQVFVVATGLFIVFIGTILLRRRVKTFQVSETRKV